MNKKLRIGWFTFTCCEDSTIIFTELLNKHWFTWKDQIEFVHAKVLQNTNTWGSMDVSFVEGAISSVKQEEKLHKIRSLSKYVVAIGACACIGMPSSQRNQFDPTQKAQIQPFLNFFSMNQEVKTIEQIVTVDKKVNGCPMIEPIFLQTLNDYLKEFGITKQ